MSNQTMPPARGAGARAACLQRLATSLSSYGDLAVEVWVDGAAPCLAARNMAVPQLSETVAIARLGDGLAFLWSWGDPIGDASDADSAAQAIAYVLSATQLKE